MMQLKERIHQITDTYDLDKGRITFFSEKNQAHLVTYCDWANTRIIFLKAAIKIYDLIL